METLDYRSELARSLMMGPSSLRIAEELCSGLELPSTPRILDLGCGRSLSTLYLARRYPDAQVFAVDLWIEPSENLELFRSQGIDDRVIPLKGEADSLPFAASWFDLIISIDSWHYFGTEPGFVDRYIAPLLRPGGRLLTAVPGWKAGVGETTPEALSPWIKDDMGFRSGAWWQALWESCSDLSVAAARELACHDEAWADWLSCDNEYTREDIPMMDADGGRYMAMVALEAERTGN